MSGRPWVAFYRLIGIRRWSGPLVLDHALDGRGSQVKSCPGEHLRDLSLAKGRAQRLESLDDVADEVRELVDRLSELDQGVVAIFVDSLQPGGYGRWFDEEGLGGLGKRPCPSGFEFEDGHAFGGGVVWFTVRVDSGHASVFDAEFLTEELGLLLESVVLGCKANASVDAVGGPAPGAGDGVVSQRNDVDDCRADGIRPSRRQRNVRQSVITHW